VNTLDPIEAARADIVGSKHLIASVADDLSQHQQWLENYRVSEKRHACWLQFQEVRYQTELKRRATARSVIEIEAFGVDDGVVARLRALDGVDAVSIEQVEQAHVVAIQSQRGPAMIPALLAELGDIAVGRVVAREPTLEDAYVELVSS